MGVSGVGVSGVGVSGVGVSGVGVSGVGVSGVGVSGVGVSGVGVSGTTVIGKSGLIVTEPGSTSSKIEIPPYVTSLVNNSPVRKVKSVCSISPMATSSRVINVKLLVGNGGFKVPAAN